MKTSCEVCLPRGSFFLPIHAEQNELSIHYQSGNSPQSDYEQTTDIERLDLTAYDIA